VRRSKHRGKGVCRRDKEDGQKTSEIQKHECLMGEGALEKRIGWFEFHKEKKNGMLGPIQTSLSSGLGDWREAGKTFFSWGKKKIRQISKIRSRCRAASSQILGPEGVFRTFLKKTRREWANVKRMRKATTLQKDCVGVQKRKRLSRTGCLQRRAKERKVLGVIWSSRELLMVTIAR